MLLLHDAFGDKDNFAELVAKMNSGFFGGLGGFGGGVPLHVVCPDLAGHGEHHTGPGRGEGHHSLRQPEDYRAEEQVTIDREASQLYHTKSSIIITIINRRFCFVRRDDGIAK